MLCSVGSPPDADSTQGTTHSAARPSQDTLLVVVSWVGLAFQVQPIQGRKAVRQSFASHCVNLPVTSVRNFNWQCTIVESSQCL